MSLLFNMLSRLVIAFFPKEQASFNFMAAVTICSDFDAPQNKVSHCFHHFPLYLPWSGWDQMPWSWFSECWVLSQLFHSFLDHFCLNDYFAYFSFCGWEWSAKTSNLDCGCVCVFNAQSCPTLSAPIDCSPPGSSVHGILQTRIPEWVAMPFSRGSSWPRDQTCISCVSYTAGRFLTIWVTGEAQLWL